MILVGTNIIFGYGGAYTLCGFIGIAFNLPFLTSEGYPTIQNNEEACKGNFSELDIKLCVRQWEIVYEQISLINIAGLVGIYVFFIFVVSIFFMPVFNKCGMMIETSLPWLIKQLTYTGYSAFFFFFFEENILGIA